jgi:hypothetical protein
MTENPTSEEDENSEEYVDTRPRHEDGSLVFFCSFCGAPDTERKLAIGGFAACCLPCAQIIIEELTK